MRLQKSIIYALVLALIIAIALVFKKNDYSNEKEYNKLFSNLQKDIDDVARIEIDTFDTFFYLVKEKDNWVLPNFDNHLASQKKINNFLLSIIELETIDKKTNDPQYHKKLGLEIPLAKSSFRIRLLNKDKVLLNDFILGNNSLNNEKLSYIRKFSDNQTWLFKNEIDIYKNEINWFRDSLLKIARWRIKSIYIDNYNEEKIDISKNNYSDQFFKLNSLPKGYKVMPDANLNRYASLLESVKITDITKLKTTNYGNKTNKIIFETFDGLIINITTFELNKNIYANFTILSDINSRKELPKDSPKIVGLPKLISFDEVNDEVLKYQYLKDWVYQLNKDFYDEINIKLKDLISKNND